MAGLHTRATELLRDLTDKPDAEWRDAQLEAIGTIVEDRANALVVPSVQDNAGRKLHSESSGASGASLVKLDDSAARMTPGRRNPAAKATATAIKTTGQMRRGRSMR